MSSHSEYLWYIPNDVNPGHRGDTTIENHNRGVAAIVDGIGEGAAADLALGDLAADVILGAVGVEWNLRAIEHPQQLGLVGVQAGEQPVEDSEAGSAPEDPVEAGMQGGA